jgi:predicted outer membrane repeat protein
LTLSQSTVSGNSTAGSFSPGGGIWADRDVTLIQSTVSGNSAGGGSHGGGIFATRGVTLTQSTVSGNSAASGGGILASLSVTLTQSTVTGNHSDGTATGGGVFQANSSSNFPFSITGSIVAGNTTDGGGADLVQDPQSALTVNYSLIGTAVTPTSGAGNVVTDNPQLGPLANNGGRTFTHRLLPASPAIDAGDPGIAIDPYQFDQRGDPFQRVANGDGVGSARIDIGAYELQSLSAAGLVVDTTADEDDGDYSPGDRSLREVIGAANGSVSDDMITFAPALSGATITLGGAEIEIAEAVTIDARPLAQNLTINAIQA